MELATLDTGAFRPCEPEPYESRPAIVSSGVKGRVGTRKIRQSSMHAARQILTPRCMTTPPQTPQLLKGVGLWARAHPKNGGQGQTHRGRPRVAGCKPCKSPVYSKRIAYTASVVSDAGPRRGAGLGATPQRCPGRRPGLLWRTLAARALRQGGRNSEHLESCRDRAPETSRDRFKTVRRRRGGFSDCHECARSHIAGDYPCSTTLRYVMLLRYVTLPASSIAAPCLLRRDANP